MCFKSKAYLVLILTVGVLSLARYLPEFRPQDPFRFAAYLILALLASGLKINLPGIRGTMSVLFLFLLIGVIELSLPETLVIAVAAVVCPVFLACEGKAEAHPPQLQCRQPGDCDDLPPSSPISPLPGLSPIFRFPRGLRQRPPCSL